MESSKANGATQEELDQIQRSTKRAKRFWSNRAPEVTNGPMVSFADIVAKGMDGSNGYGEGEEEVDTAMGNEKGGADEGNWSDTASDWDTASEREDTSEEDI